MPPIILKLDDVMAERGVGLMELAEQVGITPANLSHIKTGKARAMRFSTLEKLCAILECSPGDLMSYEPAPKRASDQDE